MTLKVIVLKQIIENEDNINYYPIELKDYLNGDFKINKRHKITNYHTYVDKVLSCANISMFDEPINSKELNCKFEKSYTDIMGFFETFFICITPNGIYKNIYALKQTKIGEMNVIRLQASFIPKLDSKNKLQVYF